MEITFRRNIPVRIDTDVFVAGGGPAGVAAAVAAAKSGCRVYLAESRGCFGGMGTSGLVPAFMQFSDGVHFLADGVGREIYERLAAAGGVGEADRMAIKPEVFKRVYDDLVIENGIDFTFETNVIGVDKEGENVEAAILSAKSGLFAVRAKLFIDCTGDGDLAVFAGAAYEKGDAEGNMQPGTLCSVWNRVDWPHVRGEQQEQRIDKAFEEGVLPVHDRHLPGMWHIGEILGGGNIGHAFGVDGTDERSLTKAFVEQRRLLTAYQEYYRKYLDGFKDIELVATAPAMGIRESRRITGDYELNVNDFKNQSVFDDEIGRYCYPIDIHASKPDAADFAKFAADFHSFRYKKGESYGIPYRSLIPRGIANLLVAGRCISCDRYLEGSVRVMPGCYITGQAAGAAAAAALEKGGRTRAVDVSDLQRRLLRLGAYLPNAASGRMAEA